MPDCPHQLTFDGREMSGDPAPKRVFKPAPHWAQAAGIPVQELAFHRVLNIDQYGRPIEADDVIARRVPAPPSAPGSVPPTA